MTSTVWSSRRPNLVWFRRADYMGPADRPLDEVVRDRVEEELGRRPRGAVRMLTQLRTFGYVFNPVTFYYCFDEDERLDAVVAEITNTPWNERHAYVLDAENAPAGAVGSDRSTARSPCDRPTHAHPASTSRRGSGRGGVRGVVDGALDHVLPFFAAHVAAGGRGDRDQSRSRGERRRLAEARGGG